ncbi:MAG: SH3 domain-containing protein, partial [Chloroflexota bacterium]
VRPDEGTAPSGGNNQALLLGGVALLAILLIGVGAYMLFGRAPQTVATEPAGESSVAAADEGAAVTSTDETAVEATAGDGSLAIGSASADALPTGIAAASDVLAASGGQVNLGTPLSPSDDLFVWDGQSWAFQPSTPVNGTTLLVNNVADGSELIIGRRSDDQTVALGAYVNASDELATDYLPLLDLVTVGDIRLGDGGTLEGEVTGIAPGGYQQMLRVTNVSAIVDQTTLTELLNDPNLQSVHIQSLMNIVNSGNFVGVNLDYQGAFDAQEAAYTQFVTNLAGALQAQNKLLYVTLDTPSNVDGFNWDSAGQNWAAIGQISDGVIVNMPLDPTIYADGGQADAFLSWATNQIDRDKIIADLSVGAIDRFGGVFRAMPLSEALTNIGEVELVSAADSFDVGSPVDFSLAGQATPLEWDGSSLTYKFTYNQSGEPRTVWINSSASLASRLSLLKKYNLQGVTLDGLSQAGDAGGYVAALQSFETDSVAPDPQGAAITWTVLNAEGGVVASEAGDQLSYSWPGSELGGEFILQSEFVQGEVKYSLGEVGLTVGEAVVEAVSAEAETAAGAEVPAEESAEEAADAAESTEEVAADSGAEAPLDFTGESNGVVNVQSNVRTGPGVIYAVAGGLEPGEQLQLVGRSGDSLWYEFVKLSDESEGWIYGQLVNVRPGFDTAGLPVSAVAAAPIAAAPSSGGDGGGDSGGGGTAPPPVAAPANLGGGFELGGQTHTLESPALMQASGMTWVKFQHKWGCGNNPADVQGRIDAARANGFKILLSIPGSPYPTSIDHQCYVDFLGGVAALGPDAIEVWNEMNIDFEWPPSDISGTSYVNNMLAPAYNAIKAANPNVLVISGAPAPTGFFGGGCGATGCDDDEYLRQMAAAGAASYMDCVGLHYNAGATAPGATSGHPADGSGHYSWYFMPTLNLYANTLGKPVCITELGYLSGEGWGGLPSNFSWAGNTSIAEHAAWLGEAVSMAANSGRVRMVIVFNVDFTLFDGADPQAGYAIRRADGSCPACGTMGAVMGR